jgi:hypothetical protein
MKVTTMFSLSRTRRDAREQKGLMCPVGYVEVSSLGTKEHSYYDPISPQNMKGESRK